MPCDKSSLALKGVTFLSHKACITAYVSTWYCHALSWFWHVLHHRVGKQWSGWFYASNVEGIMHLLRHVATPPCVVFIWQTICGIICSLSRSAADTSVTVIVMEIWSYELSGQPSTRIYDIYQLYILYRLSVLLEHENLSAISPLLVHAGWAVFFHCSCSTTVIDNCPNRKQVLYNGSC